MPTERDLVVRLENVREVRGVQQGRDAVRLAPLHPAPEHLLRLPHVVPARRERGSPPQARGRKAADSGPRWGLGLKGALLWDPQPTQMNRGKEKWKPGRNSTEKKARTSLHPPA